MTRKMFCDVRLKRLSVKYQNYVVRKHLTDLELTNYCNLNRDIDQLTLNYLLMSNMFLKYIKSCHINVNAFASMTGNERNILRTYEQFKSEYGVENYCKVLVPFNDFSVFARYRCV